LLKRGIAPWQYVAAVEKKRSGITTVASNADVKNASLLGYAVSSGSKSASEDEAL
jgi:hypothetical protein